MNEMAQRFKAADVPGGAPAGHPAINYGRIGVLLLNLGTPDATGYWPMRQVNPVVWWFILNVIVLTKRPFASGEAYKSIWNMERDESPLRTITRSQSGRIAALLAKEPRIEVDWAMRYGNPSVKSRLEALQQAGCDRILLFPLYPQYSAATTATACDKAFDALKTMRWQPSLRVVPPYYDDPGYIEALAISMRENLAALDFEPEIVLASFHGLPKEYFEKGDPYYCHCAKTTRRLREALGWPEQRLMLTFQSRFGKAEWLQPYTAETIERLAKSGVKRLAVIAPGFAADCIETLEEMGIRGAETFHEHGGEKFAALPCLNDTEASIAALIGIIKRELRGWAEL
ncbi:MAG: ferrochelatase [Rhodomicrobium sp.]|nr:ferrochelatase [Rhodomicrobium sp.]